MTHASDICSSQQRPAAAEFVNICSGCCRSRFRGVRDMDLHWLQAGNPIWPPSEPLPDQEWLKLVLKTVDLATESWKVDLLQPESPILAHPAASCGP